jgi:hypothetical protein
MKCKLMKIKVFQKEDMLMDKVRKESRKYNPQNETTKVLIKSI